MGYRQVSTATGATADKRQAMETGCQQAELLDLFGQQQLLQYPGARLAGIGTWVMRKCRRDHPDLGRGTGVTWPIAVQVGPARCQLAS